MGADHDTPAFAVATFGRWWQAVGVDRHRHAPRLLTPLTRAAPTATAPGCKRPNSPRWPTRPGWPSPCVTSRPAPASGTNSSTDSSRISSNYHGESLTSHEVVVSLIEATTTLSGLMVGAELGPAAYPKGIKISENQIREPETHTITRYNWHGECDYSLNARADP